MMHCNSPDHHHHHHHCPELVVDCSFTKVIACKVGNSFVRAGKARGLSPAKVEKPPPDAATTACSYIPRFPRRKLREFTLKELGKATGNFSCERVIGRGGFGTVFRGILSDGAVVAVKVLDKDSRQGLEELQAEIRVSCEIMSLSHPDLVPVIGFHSSHKRKKAKIMIVYPFMVNGDVRRYLVDPQPSSITPLGWTTRKRIALRVARGICILHELGIVHRDIKPSNVLLDENFEAHVADLGLAKSMDLPRGSCDFEMFHGDEDSDCYYTSQICGTFGYMAPEMACCGHSSRKSDVYAFGVTLIEIVLGKTVFDLTVEYRRETFLKTTEHLFKNKEDLTSLMHLFKNKEDLTSLMQPRILGVYDESEAIELLQLGLICMQRDPRKRPLMPEVIAIMEGSSTTLKRRWDKYEYTWSDRQLSIDNQSETDSDIPSHWIRFSSVRTSGSGSGGDDDEEEVCSALEFDINDEVAGDDGNQSRRAYDFTQEEWKIEHLAGLTGSTNSRSLENDARAVFVELDQNEGGNPKQLSSQANRHKVTTKLREVLDRMREMELDHQAAMEEMHQKQVAMMQSMIKMQEQYIQKVNEMQSQMDPLKGASQKASADESNHLGISFRAVQSKLVLFCLDISFRIIFVAVLLVFLFATSII